MAFGICGRRVLAGPVSAPVKAKHVAIQAFADRAAVVPGGSLTLAIQAKMEDGWHVYWKNPGGLTGLPTAIEWTVPAGFKTADTIYPVPTTYVTKEIKETSFVLEDEAVFLTQVQVPDTVVPGKEVSFTAKVSWLACKTICIPGNVQVSLTLPVLATGAGAVATPANEELFEDARDELPLLAEKAAHLTISSSLDRKTVRPGDTFTATVIADIEAGHHMQSHKPLQAYLIPAVVFAAGSDGLAIGDVKYPNPHEREDKVLGKLSEYAGKTRFEIPVEVDEDADSAPRHILCYFQHQICTDAGTCYPPQYVSFTIPVQMEGGAAPGETGGASSSLTSRGSASGGATAASEEDGAYRLNWLARIEKWFLDFGYWGVLVLAFLGGVLLNLMPCVLPVVSLKILSFVRQANEDRARVLALGIAYSLGIVIFFGFLGVLYWQTNKQFGWGQLFQRPHVVLGLSALVTALALSLFGVFALFTPKVVSNLGEKAEGEGLSSAFFTGILATILGTACTAPALSAAVAGASKFSPIQGGFVFFTVGIGMALPFLILSAKPGWLKFIPRPGPWMGTFETIMGFLLLGTVVWLLNPLRGQLGAKGLLLSLIFLLFVAIAAWMKGRIKFGDSVQRKAWLYAVTILLIVIGWVIPFRGMTTIDALVEAQIEEQELRGDGELYREEEAAEDTADDSEAIMQSAAQRQEILWNLFKQNQDRIEALFAAQVGQQSTTGNGTFSQQQSVAIPTTDPSGTIPHFVTPSEEILWNQFRQNKDRIEAILAAQVGHQDSAGNGKFSQKQSGDALSANKASAARRHANLWKDAKEIPWRHYKRKRALRDVKDGYTVFVDYTADWCVNCKVNLTASIENSQVVELMRKYHVIPYEADYTLPVKEIKADLKRFKKAGVPMYVVYRPGNVDDPEILPEILTPGIVLDALKRAGPSRIKPSQATASEEQ